MSFMKILGQIDAFVWGVPMIVMIMGTGILLSIRTKFIQVRCLPRALVYMFTNEEGAEGEVSSFGALCTALAATIGTGNIVGVATAVTTGGPGALFWMILAAFFGMATKYTEGLLAVKYRNVDEDGHSLGGPFLYIEKGMGSQWKWLGKAFAIFASLAGILGIGTTTQVNGIANAVKGFADPDNMHMISIFGHEYSWAMVGTAIVVGGLTGLVIIGGLERIAKVTTVVVPFMAVAYFCICIAIIINNADKLGSALLTIITSAFGGRAVTGGALGFTMMTAMRMGVSRGIFSNEAGLGSAPIAAAAAKTNTAGRQGLISMTGTFIDTIIICTLTGLTLVVTGAINTEHEGANITGYAFGNGLPWSESIGSGVLMLCLAFFAFTTILGWDYYGERCIEYIVGENSTTVKVYRWLFLASVCLGSFLPLQSVWTVADIFNGLMALPNLVGLICLSGIVSKETKEYVEMDNQLRLKSKQMHKII